MSELKPWARIIDSSGMSFSGFEQQGSSNMLVFLAGKDADGYFIKAVAKNKHELQEFVVHKTTPITDEEFNDFASSENVQAFLDDLKEIEDGEVEIHDQHDGDNFVDEVFSKLVLNDDRDRLLAIQQRVQDALDQVEESLVRQKLQGNGIDAL